MGLLGVALLVFWAALLAGFFSEKKRGGSPTGHPFVKLWTERHPALEEGIASVVR
jgi:hypothetical protein